MFSPRGIWQTIGVMLFLIAMFLVLEHGTAATSLIKAGSKGGIGLVEALQGRSRV
jgi:hypothetical protein